MTDEWNVVYWAEDDDHSPVEQWLDSLTKEQFKAIAKEILLLEKCGNLLRMPHSRALGEKLFELRDKQFGLRIYYTFSKGKIIILLCAGDKDSQSGDIKIARGRLSCVQNEKEGK